MLTAGMWNSCARSLQSCRTDDRVLFVSSKACWMTRQCVRHLELYELEKKEEEKRLVDLGGMES